MPKSRKFPNDRIPLFDNGAAGLEATEVPPNPRSEGGREDGWTTVYTSEDTLVAEETRGLGDVELEVLNREGAHRRHGDGASQCDKRQQSDGLDGAGPRNKREYSWAWLCTPRLPCAKPSAPPPFFYLHTPVSWALAAVMGLQHALAMMGGIVTTPILVSGPDYLRLSTDDVLYMISAGLIVSGLTSFIQIRAVEWRGWQLGTGLVSVMGTSFTFIPIVQVAAQFLMQEETSKRCEWDGDCEDAWAGVSGPFKGISKAGVTNAGQCSVHGFCKHSGREAYGAFLGTAMLCSLLELLLSCTPARLMRKAFPPIVSGVCVLLIGVGLTGTGFKYWGGGAACAESANRRKMEYHGPDLPGNVTGALYPSESPCRFGACDPPDGKFVGVCRYTGPAYDVADNVTKGDLTTCEAFSSPPGVAPYATDPMASWILCGSNGEVTLPFGSPQYLTLGASVFGFLLLVELVGSPFMRNCNLILALAAGFLIASTSRYITPDGDSQRYVVLDALSATPPFLFLWARRFPLAVYPPLIPPMLICFVITAVETIGDITASAEASRVVTYGSELAKRIQGGLLADGVNSFLACSVFSLPNTTISQNAAVISLTRCANRRAGYCCCIWLILVGILAKTAALINSIPKAVVGGMTTFLFVNVAVSGISILAMDKLDRRRRFILAGALGVGIGVAIVPAWATNALWPAIGAGTGSGAGAGPEGGVQVESKLVQLLRNSAKITLSTPYCIGTIIALVLNAVLPQDTAEEEEPEHEHDADTEAQALPTRTPTADPQFQRDHARDHARDRDRDRDRDREADMDGDEHAGVDDRDTAEC
mmetsp:Transcript_62408/g.147118  ORF Transcript_62408/g.147118 Transcript_62408/m.147118 type:complete len:819 (-) Transcript_62408:369-2825(-)